MLEKNKKETELTEKKEVVEIELTKEVKEVETKKETKEVEEFVVTKILSPKAVMARSTKTGLLYSKPNNKYYVTQKIK